MTEPSIQPDAPLQDVHVRELTALVAPGELQAELPVPEAARRTVLAARDGIQSILRGEDDRLLAIVGPCSIHDPVAALDYAKRLARLREEVSDRLRVVMRVYFEKPRTTVGWKGMISDPRLDDSFAVEEGLRLARRLLIDINALGLPAATEFLDPIVPQYIADLVSWAAIGARTTESQTHRQMASGLSMPVGFKNSTDGNLQNAINAMLAARTPHSFLGINAAGRSCVIHTEGNAWCHCILRGGAGRPNYDRQNIDEAAAKLTSAGLDPMLMVDCSHANCGKRYEQQEVVWQNVVGQKRDGEKRIMGIMLESNLEPGRQALGDDPADLRYGVSITDECVGWPKTEELLRYANQTLKG